MKKNKFDKYRPFQGYIYIPDEDRYIEFHGIKDRIRLIRHYCSDKSFITYYTAPSLCLFSLFLFWYGALFGIFAIVFYLDISFLY